MITTDINYAVEEIRIVLRALPAEQRAELFKELGNCRCASFDKLPPTARTGALIGGMLGAVLGISADKSPPPTPEEKKKHEAVWDGVPRYAKKAEFERAYNAVIEQAKAYRDFRVKGDQNSILVEQAAQKLISAVDALDEAPRT